MKPNIFTIFEITSSGLVTISLTDDLYFDNKINPLNLDFVAFRTKKECEFFIKNYLDEEKAYLVLNSYFSKNI